MKIAYLILAHHMPVHLNKLLDALNSEESVFFIHVDLKSDINFFQRFKETNVKLIDERVNLNRFGFSNPIAMINLITAAQSENCFDYYIILSGQDYPIKSNAYIQKYLSKNKGTSFINFYPLFKGADMYDWVTKHYYVDYYASFPKLIVKHIKRIEDLINRFLPERKLPFGYIPYRGSQWTCLYKDVVIYLLYFINSTQEGKEILNFFKSVKCPEEILFQTIIINSKFAKTCRYFDRDVLNNNKFMKNENKAYLHYIDWDPDREDPAILDESDFVAISKSEFLFARKFDEVKSRRLLEMIDSQLLKL